MKIPKQIRLFGRMIDVFMMESRSCADKAGRAHFWYDEIRLATDDQKEAPMAECLLHEIIEFIDHDLELKLEHPQITALSTAIFAAIRDNNLDFREE